MPKPRTATAILDARGSFEKNPDRKRVDPVVDDPFPETAPAELTPLQVKYWHLVRKQVPGAVLTAADQLAVKALACLAAEHHLDPDAFPAAKLGHMRGLMGSFGMTPADRAKLASAPSDDGNDDF